MANVEAICAASPRMQGLSLGPADLAANRRMKTTRVGGGHPGYLVRQDPDAGRARRAARRRTSRTCGTTRSPAWSTPASPTACCRTTGRSATSPTRVACEDQFRNAYLLGCVGAWSLHPAQVEIAKRVFSPPPEDVAHARRVVEAMGDGTGAVLLDGKMEDDASVKQCKVVLELAQQLAARDPSWRRRTGCERATLPAAAVGPVHAGGQRAGAGEGQGDPVRRHHLRPRGRRRPRLQGARPRAGRRRGDVGRVRDAGADDPLQRAVDAVGRRRPRRRRRRRAGGRWSSPRSTRPPTLDEVAAALDAAGGQDTSIWAMVETPTAIFDVRAIAAHERVSACSCSAPTTWPRSCGPR